MKKFNIDLDPATAFISTDASDELNFESMIVKNAPYKLIYFDKRTYQYLGDSRLVWDQIFNALVPNGVVILKQILLADERTARDTLYNELKKFEPLGSLLGPGPYITVQYKQKQFVFPFHKPSRSFTAYLKSAGVPKETIFSSTGDLEVAISSDGRTTQDPKLINQMIVNHTVIDWDNLQIKDTHGNVTGHIISRKMGGDYHEHNFHVDDLQYDPRFRVYYDTNGTCVVVKESS